MIFIYEILEITFFLQSSLKKINFYFKKREKIVIF